MENRTMQSSTLEPTGNGHELRSRRIADVVICLARSELGLGVYHTLTSLIGAATRVEDGISAGRVASARRIAQHSVRRSTIDAHATD
jgi:hypothetical protein